MQKREQQFTTKFQQWLMYNHNNKSMAWEVKVAERGERIPYNTPSTQKELRNLHLAKHKQVIYKLSDYAATGTPFDGFLLAKSLAYFVVHFYAPGNKMFYLIDVDKVYEHIESGAKSLTEDDARDMGYTAVLGIKNPAQY